MTHPNLTDPPAFTDPLAEEFDQTLLIALGGGEQIDPGHWVQRIHDTGAVVGFHVHHRLGKNWTEQRVLFAPLLDLAITDPDASVGEIACPSCGEILRPNVMR